MLLLFSQSSDLLLMLPSRSVVHACGNAADIKQRATKIKMKHQSNEARIYTE